MARDSEVQFSVEEMAASIERVFAAALEQPAADWEKTNYQDQVQYLTLAERGPDLLAAQEGRTWREAAYACFCVFRRAGGIADTTDEMAWGNLPQRYLLAWEAVTRHIAMLTQSDDADLAAAEAVWPEWVKKRMEDQR